MRVRSVLAVSCGRETWAGLSGSVRTLRKVGLDLSDKPTRFRLIQGDAKSDKPKVTIKPAGTKSFAIEKFECVSCSAKAGHPYGTLIELRVGGHVIAGALVGGSLFWCCKRCEKPHFHIKDFSLTK